MHTEAARTADGSELSSTDGIDLNGWRTEQVLGGRMYGPMHCTHADRSTDAEAHLTRPSMAAQCKVRT